MPKPFLVTGCGRSGTTYTSALFTSIGLECQHEAYFPHRVFSKRYFFNYYLAKLGVKRLMWDLPPYGEAAWQAAPFLRYLPAHIVVLHQVRHPLAYIRSRQAKGLVNIRTRKHFTNVSFGGAKTRQEFFGLPLKEQVNHLAKFWVQWNRLVEVNSESREYYRYKVEDLDQETITFLLNRIGHQSDKQLLAQQIRGIDKNLNTQKHTQKHDRISLRMLDGETYKDLSEMSGRYGYDLSDCLSSE